MKALRIYAERDIRYEEVPTPVPGPDELLVRVRAAGLCRTDIEVYLHHLYHYKVGVAKLPVTPGHEWAGVVEAVGPGVEGIAVGDNVTCETALGCGWCQLCLSGHQNICASRIEMGIINRDGAMADYVLAPRRTVHPIGDMPFEIAAMAEPTAVSVYAVHTARVGPSDRVLVLGAGPIGQLIAQAARAYGARLVVVAARSSGKLELASRLGADAAVSLKDTTIAELTEDLTGGEGFDVVLEAAGAAELVQGALDAAARRARVIYTGSFSGKLASIDPDFLICKELTIAGTIGGGACYEEAILLLESGRIDAEPLITERRSLADAPAVFAEHAQGAGNHVKVMFTP